MIFMKKTNQKWGRNYCKIYKKLFLYSIMLDKGKSIAAEVIYSSL